MFVARVRTPRQVQAVLGGCQIRLSTALDQNTPDPATHTPQIDEIYAAPFCKDRVYLLE